MNKTFADNIYGNIELSELALQIVDTIEFQRLRNLKQLGNTHLVFPGANHTRFEHSLGVYYLAGIYINNLVDEKHSISPRLIEIIKIAGLVHDLGHCAFSHLFDDHVIEVYKLPKHETRSCILLKDIISKYDIKIEDSEYELICDIINGRYNTNYPRWIFQIISNSDFQLDVDKLDYIVRDCYYTGIKHTLQISRIFKHAKIIDDYICFDEKVKILVFDIFMCRYRLHLEVYKHRVVIGYDLIMKDILIKLINILGDKFNWITFTDNIIEIIPILGNDELIAVYTRLKSRQAYKRHKNTDEDKKIVYSTKIALSGSNQSPFNNIKFIRDNKICNINPSSMLKLFTNEFEEHISYTYYML